MVGPARRPARGQLSAARSRPLWPDGRRRPTASPAHRGTDPSWGAGGDRVVPRLRSTLSLLEETIAQLSEDYYVAPIGVEAHRYLVKRPSGIYQYNKLTSREAIFPPQEREDSVKVIHLSSDYDSRNFEGRAGIERRNRLLAIGTAIDTAEALLNRARSIAANRPVNEVVAEKIARIPPEDGDADVGEASPLANRSD